MAMTQAIQAASRTSYRRRAAAFNSVRRAELPLFQAFLRFSHQETTEYHCIKEGTPIDPACGSGSLLLTVGQQLNSERKPGAVTYYGQELNTGTFNIALMNLLMHNVIYQDVHLNNADTLGRDWPDGPDSQGVDHPRMFDAVVENPPYSAKWSAVHLTKRMHVTGIVMVHWLLSPRQIMHSCWMVFII